jgi:hypothetical protein
MRSRLLLAVILLSSCMRSSRLASREDEDTSIVFPNFHEQFAVRVGEPGRPYELDGVTLRALTIALDELYPPGSKDQSCWSRPEAHRYRVIRQDDIIFVEISPQPGSCEGGLLLLDSGARFAIHADGRILRRHFDGEPGGPFDLKAPDAGTPGPVGESYPASQVGTVWGKEITLPSRALDGGTRTSPGTGDGGSP